MVASLRCQQISSRSCHGDRSTGVKILNSLWSYGYILEISLVESIAGSHSEKKYPECFGEHPPAWQSVTQPALSWTILHKHGRGVQGPESDFPSLLRGIGLFMLRLFLRAPMWIILAFPSSCVGDELSENTVYSGIRNKKSDPWNVTSLH